MWTVRIQTELDLPRLLLTTAPYTAPGTRVVKHCFPKLCLFGECGLRSWFKSFTACLLDSIELNNGHPSFRWTVIGTKMSSKLNAATILDLKWAFDESKNKKYKKGKFLGKVSEWIVMRGVYRSCRWHPKYVISIFFWRIENYVRLRCHFSVVATIKKWVLLFLCICHFPWNI